MDILVRQLIANGKVRSTVHGYPRQAAHRQWNGQKVQRGQGLMERSEITLENLVRLLIASGKVRN